MFVVTFDSADLGYPTMGSAFFAGDEKESVCLSTDNWEEGFKEFIFPTEDEARDFVISYEGLGWCGLWVSAHEVSPEDLLAEV